MPPDSVGSWTLATVAMWCDKCPADAGCYELMAATFGFDVLWNDGVEKINKIYQDEQIFAGRRIAKPHAREVSRDFAKIVAEAVEALRDADYKFVVPADDLHRVPGVTQTSNAAANDTAVVTRIANLERNDTAILDMMREMQGQLKSLASRQAPITPAVQLNDKPTNFNELYGRGGRGRSRDTGTGAIPKRKDGSKEPSPKRKREEAGAEAAGDEKEDKKDDYVTVVKKKTQKQKPKVTYGKGITAVAGAVRPVDFFIGGTDKNCTEDIVRQVLTHIARTMPEGMELDCELEIEKVTLLTKPREGQKIYSKSWQVTVPEKFRAHMMRAESIPAGWNTRRFYPPRAPRPPPAGGAMKAQIEAAEAAKQAQAASLQPKWGEDGYVPPGAPTKSS